MECFHSFFERQGAGLDGVGGGEEGIGFGLEAGRGAEGGDVVEKRLHGVHTCSAGGMQCGTLDMTVRNANGVMVA